MCIEMTNVSKILVGRHQVKRPLGRRRHIDSITLKSMFENTMCDDVILHQMPQDRGQRITFVNLVLDIRVLRNTSNCLTI